MDLYSQWKNKMILLFHEITRLNFSYKIYQSIEYHCIIYKVLIGVTIKVCNTKYLSILRIQCF